jgi:hypothetical protein
MARKRPAEVKLLTLLAEGEPVARAAAAVGLSERTVFRRLSQPGFRRELARIRARVIERAVAILAAGQLEAAVRLRQLMAKSPDEKVQLRAAVKVLELGWKGVEHTDFAERLNALEERLPKEESA